MFAKAGFNSIRLKLFQEPRVVVAKETDVVADVAEHVDAFDAERGSGEDQPALRFRNRAAKRLGGGNPFLDDHIHIF